MSIHQFHSGSAPADAVTNSMLFIRSLLRGFGFASEVYAEHIPAELAGNIAPLADLQLRDDDCLLIHHSMGHDALPRLTAQRGRKFLIYHNITPPEFFADDAVTEAYATKGYAQLDELRGFVEAAIAVSAYNGRQLRDRGFDDVTVIPLLKDFAALRSAPHRRWPYHDDNATFRILFVGRIVPHKRQHELIEFVHRVRAVGGVPIELVLVGQADAGNAYKAQIDNMIRQAGIADRIKLTGRISDEELFGWYRAANAFVSFSEHEGFGVPLIEAMAFDLPVIAYASGAIEETLGEAGVIFADKHSAAVTDALARLCADRPYRRALIQGQRRRLLQFSRQGIASALWEWVVRVGAAEGGGMAAVPPAASETDEAAPTKSRQYIVEGPWETSYSLALVNRNIALALDNRPGCRCYIEPAEGTEEYSVDPVAAAKQPEELRRLVASAPITLEPVVTIRNTFPPRPNGMLGDFRLLHLAWEESAIPDALARQINLHADGVLVPSRYCKRIVRNSGVRLPIMVVGHGIDHAGALPRELGSRERRGPVSEAMPFTFLHISSGLARKGIEELVSAYSLAFSAADPVLLVIKTIDNPFNIVDEWVERLTGRSSHGPAIQIISQDVGQREMEFLYHVADALVLPARGEGFNLPAAEGMGRGLPVIVTRHSGHLDFCNDENAFLVDCRYELSESHLRIEDSYWARPCIEPLIEIMKDLFRQGRSRCGSVATRAARGRGDAMCLRWCDVGQKIDDFVAHLERRPVMAKKIRVGWVSTYNTRCGIAEYSKHLLTNLDRNIFEITIVADREVPETPDPDNVKRLWQQGAGPLTSVTEFLIKNSFDFVVFQYNKGFFEPAVFADRLAELTESGIGSVVFLHRTSKVVEENRPGLGAFAESLKHCAAIFVHSIADVERLRQAGVVDNVVLLPHGVIDRPEMPTSAVRALLGLSACRPVIGSFGFVLPGKGLPELIQAFALLLRAFPAAYLLLINAEYPSPESREAIDQCQKLIRLLGLGDRVRLVTEFLEIEEATLLLNACDATVFPYQHSEESASGALRFGLAAGAPVLATPLPIFSDLGGIIHELPGCDSSAIANGIISLLNDPEKLAIVRQRQQEWVRAHSWSTQSARISNIIIGAFEDARNAELRAPVLDASGAEAENTFAPGGEPDTGPRLRWPTENSASDSDSGIALTHRNAADRAPRLIPAMFGRPQRERRFRLLRRPNRPNGVMAAMRRADWARDAREWRTAAQYYREALDQKPDNASIWVQYGHALKEMGHLQEAEEAYRASLELVGDLSDTHLQLGHLLKLQDRKIEAGFCYLRALTLDPALEDAFSELRHLGWTRSRIQLALRRERVAVDEQ